MDMLFGSFLTLLCLRRHCLPAKLYSSFKAQVKHKCFVKFFLTHIGVSYLPLCHHISMPVTHVTGLQFLILCVWHYSELSEVREDVSLFSTLSIVLGMYWIHRQCLMKENDSLEKKSLKVFDYM